MTADSGARLDRLPISRFHRRIMLLIGAGMFFDGFDIYVAATVLGATLKSGFSTMGQNAQFMSLTFVGMMLGSFLTGFLGDGYGTCARRCRSRPELFPTEVLLRASGICNTFGRAATILTPFLAVALFRSYGIRGVLSLMIGFLLVQIVVVLRFGIEPKKRRLEDVE